MILALKKKGKTVFLATARADDAVELSDELALLRDGVLSELAPTAEWLESCSLTLRVAGEKQTVLSLLSEIDGLVACQPLGKDGDGALIFRIRAVASDRRETIVAALEANGLECSAEEEEEDDTLAVLRAACDVSEMQEEADAREEENA